MEETAAPSLEEAPETPVPEPAGLQGTAVEEPDGGSATTLERAATPREVSPEVQEVPVGIIRFKIRPSLVPTLIRGLLSVAVLALLYPLASTVLRDSGSVRLVASLVLGVVAVVAVGVIVQSAARLLQLLFTRYAVTSKYLIVERGILSRARKTIPLERIQDAATTQSAIERLLGIGDVVVETAGEQGAAELHDLPHCKVYQEAILRAAEERVARLTADE